MKLLLCLFATFVVALAERKTYKGYNIWEVSVNGRHQAEALRAMEEAGKLEIFHLNASRAEVWMGPEGMASVSPAMRGLGITMRLPSDPKKRNIPERMAAQFKRLDERFAKDNYAFDASDFNRYSDWMTQLNVWVAACPTGLECTVSTIGNSHEGRAIKKIVIKKAGSSNQKIYLEHTIHCREWLSTTTVGKVIDHIIKDYATSTEVKSLVDKYDLHIIPIVNPDGYEYTWNPNGDRMWRKNRSPNSGSNCVGTDLNRNFNAHWSKQGTSTNRCAATYHGKSAGSEAETKVIQNEAQANKANIKAWFAVHCCYDVWMFPYGFNENYNSLYPCAKTADHDNLMAVGNAAIDAINAGWRTGTICDVIYAATGDTANYAYDKAGIKNTFAVELHGNFIASKSEITPAYNDFWKGLIASVNKINTLS